MNINIARQPLIPAFLTLTALAVVAMWRAGSITPPLTPEITIPTEGVLAIASPEELITRFQEQRPVWACCLGALLMIFCGTSVGRLSLRYNLYGIGTCLAIPLFGAVMTALALGTNFLPILSAATLLTLAFKNYCRSFRSGYSFDALFRASLYLGALPLVAPSLLPMVALLPLAVILFHRTLRETVAALAGLLLPVFVFCYVNWGAGGDFTAPLTLAWKAFTQGSALEAARTIPLRPLVTLGAVVVLDVVALIYFLTDIYAVGTKPRAILIFTACLLALFIPVMMNPASTAAAINLTAIPSAILLPVLLVRIHRIPASILYLLILAGAVANLLLQ